MKPPFRTLWDGGAYGPVVVTRGGSHGGRCVRLRCHQLVQQSHLNAQWGELLFGAVTGEEHSAEERWERVIESIQDNRPLWHINFEAIVLAQHSDAIRAGLAARGEAARAVLARAFGGLESDHDAGSRHYATLIGVAAQWLLDPETAPSASAIAHPEGSSSRIGGT